MRFIIPTVPIMVAAMLAYAAFRPELHGLATVVRADWLALTLLVAGAAAHLKGRE